MAGNDIYSILMGSDPEAKESARALAAAIRGNRNWAMAGGLAAADPMKAMTGMQADFGKQDENLLEKAAQMRLHYAPQAEEAAARKAMYANPTAREILGNIGPSLAPGRVTPEQFRKLDPRMQTQLMPILEKVGQGDQANATRLLLAQQIQGAKQGIQEEKLHQTGVNDINKWMELNNPAAKARSALGLSAQNVYRAFATKPLIQGQMVPPQFIEDAAIQIARIAGGNGQISHEMVNELKARGLKADVASIKGYLLSTPVDVGMTKWLALIDQKLDQEIAEAEKFQRGNAVRQLGALTRAQKHAPEEYQGMIDRLGLRDYVSDKDLITPVAPAGHAGIVGKSHIAEGKKLMADDPRAPPGSRLAFDRQGGPHAIPPGEKGDPNWWVSDEVK